MKAGLVSSETPYILYENLEKKRKDDRVRTWLENKGKVTSSRTLRRKM